MKDDKNKPTPRNPLPDEDKNPTRPQPGKMPDFSDTELGDTRNEEPDDAGNLDIYSDRGGDEAFDEEG